MKTGVCLVGAWMGLVFSLPAVSASNNLASQNALMGIAIGNTVVADYGEKGKVVGDFNADGTVDWVFPSGEKSHQRWIADDKFFCTMKSTSEETAFTYRCERNMLAGKKLGQHWRYVDSTGEPVMLTVQPRSP